MKLTSSFGAPFRFRAVVASADAPLPHLAGLDRSIVVSQLVIVALCVARAAVDFRLGPLGLEGRVAATVACVIVASLIVKLLSFSTSASFGVRDPRPAHSPGPRSSGARQGRNR